MVLRVGLIRASLAIAAVLLMFHPIVLHAAASESEVGVVSPDPSVSPPDGKVPEGRGDNVPLLQAEGSNACEIVSCGMGIKDTCKITCPAGKTPKCSCDCAKSFGPMCTEYKANCRCE